MEDTSSQDDIFNIQSLPRMLNFTEEDAPILKQTHERIVKAARNKADDSAEAASHTYRDLAEVHVEQQLRRQRDLPNHILKNIRAKAILGIKIKIAQIWHEAGAIERCIKSLDNAISYARRRRWDSIATALEIEKAKLHSAGA